MADGTVGDRGLVTDAVMIISQCICLPDGFESQMRLKSVDGTALLSVCIGSSERLSMFHSFGRRGIRRLWEVGGRSSGMMRLL